MSDKSVNTPAVFTNEKFGTVRVVTRDGEPWFVAKDVCDCLGLGNHRSSVALLDDDEKGVHTIDTPGGKQEMQVVSEPGLYSLVFRSRKPEAKEFKRWVTHEVLPAIRKTGQYSLTPKNYAEALRRLADEYEAKVQALEQVEALEVALGNARDWKTTTGIPWLNDYFADTSDRACSRIGKHLSAISRMRGLEVRETPHSKYCKVNVYHMAAIDEFKEILDADPRVLADIRK